MSSTRSSPHLRAAGLWVLLAGQLLPQVDFSIVNVALGSIAHALYASHTQLELLVAVYGVAFAVCLALGGRLGDNYGRRRLFVCGVALFGVASLLCGLAQGMALLLSARVLQGIGAALTVPQILATIHVCLQGPSHSRALGLFGAIGGLAFVLGQVLGGWLVSHVGWRSVFLINLPICGVILFCVHRYVPETRQSQTVRIDVAGTGLLALLLICLLLPLALGPTWGWTWPCVLPLLLLLPLLWLLLRVELRAELGHGAPLLPPALLAVPSMRFGLWLGLLFFACWSGFMFVLALTLQQGAGLSATTSGNSFIALGVAYFVSSLFSARVTKRYGVVHALLIGCAIQICGLLALLLTLRWTWPHPNVLNLIPATLLIGYGQALIVGGFFRIGLSGVPTQMAGTGGALLSTIQQAAFGLGSALFGALFAAGLQQSASALYAVELSLGAEVGVMLTVVASTLWFYRRSVLHGAASVGAAGLLRPNVDQGKVCSRSS